jgi:uncharacterized membrane protein YeaQ/YmgE (transglycosylase-associated protein family)
MYVQRSRAFAERRPTAAFLMQIASMSLGACVGNVLRNILAAHTFTFEMSYAFWAAWGCCIIGIIGATVWPTLARRRRLS